MVQRLVTELRHGGNLLQMKDPAVFVEDGLLLMRHLQHLRIVGIQHQDIPQHAQHQLQILFLVFATLGDHLGKGRLRLVVLYRRQ